MNHQIYGILLFISILILIYLLNKNYNQSIGDVIYNVDIKEGFDDTIIDTYGTKDTTSTIKDSKTTSNKATTTIKDTNGTIKDTKDTTITKDTKNKEPINLDNYIEYDNTYFNNDDQNKKSNKTFKDVLVECDNDSTCYGITKQKNSETIFYKITNVKSCKTSHQGSDLEKELSKNYISYIKKSIPDYDKLCILNQKPNVNNNDIISIYGYNNLVWTVKNNKIELVNLSVVDNNNDYNLCKFKIVDGLNGNNTISIKYEVKGFPVQYVVNEYPNKNYLFLRDVKDNEQEWKKRASYKMVDGLANEGFSLKMIGFPDIYILVSENKPNLLNILPIELSDDDNKKLGTFYIKPELTKELITKNLSDNDKSNNDMSGNLTPEEKAKKMKNKNLYALEKQSLMLENQMKMINSYDFIHKNNISNIGREFANQSANLALSKYLQEKDDVNLSAKNSLSIVNNGLNTPSVSQFKNKL